MTEQEIKPFSDKEIILTSFEGTSKGKLSIAKGVYYFYNNDYGGCHDNKAEDTPYKHCYAYFAPSVIDRIELIQPKLEAGYIVKFIDYSELCIVLPKNSDRSELGFYGIQGIDYTRNEANLEKIYTLKKFYNYIPFFTESMDTIEYCDLIWNKLDQEESEYERKRAELQEELERVQDEAQAKVYEIQKQIDYLD